MLSALTGQPSSRVATVICAVLAALYFLGLAHAAGLGPLASTVGPQAFKTMAEVWCISALPALWFAERKFATGYILLAAAVVPPILVELALFVLGSMIPTEEELGRDLRIMAFVMGSTVGVGFAAAGLLLLLRRAHLREGGGGA